MVHLWHQIGNQECGTLITGCRRGASHQERGRPCQDASLAACHSFKGYPYAVLAVTDGHGSARHARSELGAYCAAQAAEEAASRLLPFAVACFEQAPDSWLENVRNEFASRFPKHLHQAWQRRVEEDFQRDPPADVAPGSDPAYRLYGTTVALALVFQGYVFVGAIGDSTLYRLREAGGAEDLLAGQGRRELGLTTDSLASREAPYKWRHRVLPLDEAPMLVAVTDGFSDSLAEPLAALEGIYRDVLRGGFAWLSGVLPASLERLSREGVGDDIAVAFYFPPGPPRLLGFPADSP